MMPAGPLSWMPIPSADQFCPKHDIRETESHYILLINLPGMNEHGRLVTERIEGGGILRVQGVLDDIDVGRVKNHIKRERGHGPFVIHFPLPADAKKKSISVTCKDGILVIKIEKKEKKRSDQIFPIRISFQEQVPEEQVTEEQVPEEQEGGSSERKRKNVVEEAESPDPKKLRGAGESSIQH